MKIVAVLPWYDERPAMLDRCVRSLQGLADELLALDGRWEHFDDDAPVLSHWTQSQAIARAADAIGLEHAVWMGPTLWASQVAKRRAVMELADDAGADWVFVIDADEYVAHCDPLPLRVLLSQTENHVATVRLSDLGRVHPDRSIRRLFRAGTTVATAHNGYRFGDLWLHGDSAKVKLAPALDVSPFLILHDDGSARDASRKAKKLEYSRARARHRLEAW